MKPTDKMAEIKVRIIDYPNQQDMILSEDFIFLFNRVERLTGLIWSIFNSIDNIEGREIRELIQNEINK